MLPGCPCAVPLKLLPIDDPNHPPGLAIGLAISEPNISVRYPGFSDRTSFNCDILAWASVARCLLYDQIMVHAWTMQVTVNDCKKPLKS